MAAQSPNGMGQTLDISWSEPKGFIWLSVKNFLLSVLTLGIYYFWGKVAVRRRIWHAIRINGEPLEYTGTGKELLLGFVIGMGLLLAGIIVYAVIIWMLFGENAANDLFFTPVYLVLFWLTGVAIYRARRYRLRRTRWRGIRGTMSGSAAGFANVWAGTFVLVPLTLGWASPWRQVVLSRRLTDETRIGSAALRFSPQASAAALYPAFAWMWVASVLTVLLFIGFIMSSAMTSMMPLTAGDASDTGAIGWSFGIMGVLLLLAGLAAVYLSLRYHAVQLNWLARQTHLHNGHFTLNFQPGDLFRLVVGNALILLFSFGILLPVVQKRLARHFVESLGFEGTVDLAAIAQADDALEKTGEGLAEIFDIDPL